MSKYSCPKFILLSVLTVLVCGSCQLGSEYTRPKTAATSALGFMNATVQDKASSNHQSMSRWWERINDPILTKYVDQLLTENLQLVAAGERVIQAQAGISSERGRYYPTATLGATGSSSFRPNIFTGNKAIHLESYEANLTSAWELDLFGKIKQSVAAADASYISSIYDREALAHTLIANLLKLRIEIATHQGLLALAESTAGNREKLYTLVKNRYERGVSQADLQDVYRAENNFSSVQADVNGYRSNLADAMLRLDVLLGQTPGTTREESASFPMIPAPVDFPLCLPADLLDRRPDLRASELRVKAAHANIGVAMADLYPTLSLTGVLGFSGNTTNNLFEADQMARSLLGSVMAQVFEGGRLRANIKIRESQAREMIANYTEDVLNAMREVETHLQAEKETAGKIKSIARAVAAATQAEDIIQKRYNRGIENLQAVLDAQRDLYTARQRMLNTQSEKWHTRVALYLALGGDWFGQDVPGSCTKETVDG